MKEAVLEPASSVPSETFGQEDTWANRDWILKSTPPAWPGLRKTGYFFGNMKFNAKKKHSSADRKTRVSLVLLVAKENDLSLSIYIYSHDILQHVWLVLGCESYCL